MANKYYVMQGCEGTWIMHVIWFFCVDYDVHASLPQHDAQDRYYTPPPPDTHTHTHTHTLNETNVCYGSVKCLGGGGGS